MASNPTLPTNTEEQPRRQVNVANIFIYIVLVVGAIAALVPFLIMINKSLMTQTEASSSQMWPSEIQWDNYLNAWEEAQFAEYFWNSVQITAITVTGQVIFCTMAAYAFARMEFPGKNFLFALLLSTLMLPEAVTWVPNFLTVSWLGRVGPIRWLDSWPAQTIPFMATAFGIILLRQFFQQIPNELWDSAQIDGAGHIRYMTRIVLPLSRAPLVTLILFAFIGSWNALAWPILVTTSTDWRPISYGLQSFLVDEQARVHLQMAGSVITALPIVLVYFFTQKQFTEGITHSGLKG